jgi:flagellar basal-body rod modification protein FlgD
MSPVSLRNFNALASNAASSSGSQTTSSTATSGSTDVTKNMFLQLLVAQLKNQDPLNPADGTQFMTQLAQFQQLEQSMNSGQDITAIRQDLDALVATSNGGGSTPKS